jgi:signal transduction histidine kinase
MKEPDLSRLSGRYLAALLTHIDQGPQAGLEAARALGSEALSIGLETLDLAKLHDEALAALVPPGCAGVARDDVTGRAELFFNEANMPIERTHRIALETDAELQRTNEALNQRTRDVAKSKHETQREIVGKETARAALETNEHDSTQLLEESRSMEKHLRALARKILSSSEEERQRMSRQLQDEIAQTLLAIDVRILTLKKVAAASNAELTGEIDKTERLVEDTVKIINRVIHEYGTHHEE